MFTSSRQDLGFQRSSGTKTWRRLVEAVDLRYVQHTHSSVCTVGQVWSDETTLFLKSQINKKWRYGVYGLQSSYHKYWNQQQKQGDKNKVQGNVFIIIQHRVTK